MSGRVGDRALRAASSRLAAAGRTGFWRSGRRLRCRRRRDARRAVRSERTGTSRTRRCGGAAVPRVLPLRRATPGCGPAKEPETSTISGNSARSGGDPFVGAGGGMFNFGALTVTNSTISGNSTDEGGGIYHDDGTLTVANSTISGNSASFGGGSSPQTGPASSMKSLARSRSRAPSSPATRIVIAATTAPSPRWGSTSMATGRAASPRPATSRTSRSRTCS